MKYFYSWQEFDEDIKKIAQWARDRDFISIYGIPRGGLVIAVALSHQLQLPLKVKIEEVDIETLVVDDIADSGETLLAFEQKIGKKPTSATLFYHKDTKRMPDFSLREKIEWIVFPWETEASSKYDNHSF